MEQEARLRKGEKEMAYGYTSIAERNGIHADMGMDFGVLRLAAQDVFEDDQPLERAYLLVYGEIEFAWDGNTQTVSRKNCFDESPWVLHVPSGVKVKITGVGPDSEVTVHRTENERAFPARLYAPQDIPDENRGAGTMNEMCTRIVRTVLDKSLAPWSNFVFGEVINIPGKWSSYPPHVHVHPEIYYYKFNPEGGYGYSEYGDDVIKVENNDTVFIQPNYTHPQVAGPGYALWYMWIIRQDEKDPYQPPKYPHYIPEHEYIKEKGAKIWAPGHPLDE